MGERRTAIIGIRVLPIAKKRFLEEAERRGISLSTLLRELIVAGWNVVKQNKN